MPEPTTLILYVQDTASCMNSALSAVGVGISAGCASGVDEMIVV
jgi:hypothetical protein